MRTIGGHLKACPPQSISFHSSSASLWRIEGTLINIPLEVVFRDCKTLQFHLRSFVCSFSVITLMKCDWWPSLPETTLNLKHPDSDVKNTLNIAYPPARTCSVRSQCHLAVFMNVGHETWAYPEQRGSVQGAEGPGPWLLGGIPAPPFPSALRLSFRFQETGVMVASHAILKTPPGPYSLSLSLLC